MNTVEQPTAVNVHIANSKLNLCMRPNSSEEQGTVPEMPTSAAPSSASTVPESTSPPEVPDANLEEFKTLDEICVDENTSELLVKVPSELVGRMIGKNGLVIKELQSHSGAFINMAKEGEVFRIARISGNYPETHLCALMLVSRFTSREDLAKHEKLERLLSSYRKLRPLKPFVVENFNVPAEHVGRIIGRGGHTIRELQDVTHAKIDIPKACPGVDSHRVLTISGSPEEVAHCRDLLRTRIAHLEAAREAHETDPNNPSMHEALSPYLASFNGVYPASSYHIMPGGRMAMSMPYALDAMSSYGYGYGYMPYPMPFHSEHLSADMSRMSLSPSVDSQDSDHHDHQVPHMPGHPSPPTQHTPPAPLHAAAAMFVPSLPATPCETIVAVPADLVGRLIGRQGVAVKQLQSETKSRVDVLDAVPGADPHVRYVRITALRLDSVRACEAHIKARIAAHYGNSFS